MATIAPLSGQQLLLSSRLAAFSSARARIGACIVRSSRDSMRIDPVGIAARRSCVAVAAIEHLDNAGIGILGSPSLEAASPPSPEGYTVPEDISSSPAKGSVGVVEAMTGKTIDTSSPEILDGGIGGDGDIGRRGGDGGGGGGDESSDSSDGKKQVRVLSMSQKLTLVYAALVGVGGLMGFLKSGSTKSLFSGGLAALTLLYVYTQLPVNPVTASSLGAGISLLLLFVMGSRFRNSGKIFPAGVVSAISLIMSGGYVHGILRSKH